MRFSFFLFLVVFGSYAQKIKQSDRSLFSVGDRTVSSSEFEYVFLKNHRNRPENFGPQTIQEYLDLYILFKLKVSEAYSRGIDTTRAFQNEFLGYKNEVFKSYQTRRDDLEHLMVEAYERMKEEVRVSHLLIMVDPKAAPSDTLKAWEQVLSIRDRIIAGESFTELARAYSADPGAGQNGGDLGYFSAFEMVYPFETAAYQTSVGTLSMPVRTRFGYHLIKVTDRRPAGEKIEVSHILVGGNDSQAVQKIREAQSKLAAGESWNNVWRKYSDEAAMKDNGGRIPAFRRGGLGPDYSSFENAAFSLEKPGSVSEPVQTAQGWHLIRLEKFIRLPEFASYQSDLRKMVEQDERMYLSALRQLENQKKIFEYSENQEAKEQILSLADSSLLRGRWEFYGSPELRSKTLFTLAGEKISVWSFVEFVGKEQSPIPITALTQIRPRDLMEQMLDGFTSMRATLAEEKKLEKENQQYRMLLREYKEGILLFTVMEQEVWKKAAADTAGQRAFYLKNTSRYQAGDRVRARLLGTTDPATAEGVLKKFESGDSITRSDLRKFRSVTPLRNYEKGESRIVDMVPWSVGLHKAEYDKIVWLVEIKKLIGPGIRTLEEAKTAVISDYQSEVESIWLNELKEKFPVRVDERIKKKTFKALLSEQSASKKSETAP